jgi:hypothetical protein
VPPTRGEKGLPDTPGGLILRHKRGTSPGNRTKSLFWRIRHTKQTDSGPTRAGHTTPPTMLSQRPQTQKPSTTHKLGHHKQHGIHRITTKAQSSRELHVKPAPQIFNLKPGPRVLPLHPMRQTGKQAPAHKYNHSEVTVERTEADGSDTRYTSAYGNLKTLRKETPTSTPGPT